MRFKATTLGVLLLLVYSNTVRADLSDAEKAEDAARNSLIDHFTRFSGSRNVMGKPQSPDGKQTTSAAKPRFDPDDQNPFTSDLTYHDFSFNTTSTTKDDKGKETSTRLFAYVSPHGALTKAGGSSVLERVPYELAKQYEKQDEKKDEAALKKEEADAKQGIRYESLFKIETQEVIDGKEGANAGTPTPGAPGGNARNGGANNKGNDKGEKIKVERYTIREEAVPKIAKVGTDSFEDIRKNGRDPGYEDDEKTMANGVLLRYAAGAATQAMWQSTLADLAQRRANKGIPSGDFPISPQLSESAPRCENWEATSQQVLKNVTDKKEKEDLEKQLKKMTAQCNQMIALPYNVVNPKFKTDDKGEAKLTTGDVKKEDGFERDERVQLEILAKAGKTTQDVPSNWKYKPEDDKAKVTIDYDEGTPKVADLTVKQQLDTYNNQLKQASEGYSEVNSRLPPNLQTDPSKPLSYQIQSQTRSVMDVNYPPPVTMDEAGVNKPMTPNAPTTYTQLLKQ
jgi:hypothetical protein